MLTQSEENKGVELTGGGAKVQEPGKADTEGGGELGLNLIESAEGIGPEGQGGSNVQDVQGASAEEPGLGSGDAPGMLLPTPDWALPLDPRLRVTYR